MTPVSNPPGRFSASEEEISKLFRRAPHPGASRKNTLWLFGIVLTPVAVAGALFGYARAYDRFLQAEYRTPDMGYMTPIVRYSMISFAVIAFVAVHIFYGFTYAVVTSLLHGQSFPVIFWLFPFMFFNYLIVSLAFSSFESWQVGIGNLMAESNKFGTARFATTEELAGYENKTGIYIGETYTFSDKGHILTVAGTRGGKGTNLIIPNLLGVGGYTGSWVVIDPKGENAAITARFQRDRGQNVVILNPWDLLVDNIGQAQSYNPLDILLDKDSIHLVDDVQVIAEMLVPVETGNRDSFFSDNARSIIAGLLLHLMTSAAKEDQTLATLWQWVRLSGDRWFDLLGDMHVNQDPRYGITVKNASNEIKKLMEAGDKTFGSIIATVLQCTDFIKSPALQQSMTSGFDPRILADGNTTLYIIIPADKLQSHSRWLRLVVTTTMRAVVRKPNKRVTFLLDEFAALGYLPEIETALSTYAGFEITVWAILQSLIQLQGIYNKNWETFTANCTIRQFFSVNDNFTADYVSAAMGQATYVTLSKTKFGIITDAQSNARALVTPDELRRGSGDNIFAFFGAKPPTYYPKLPYYQMRQLINNGNSVYDENPYIKTID